MSITDSSIICEHLTLDHMELSLPMPVAALLSMYGITDDPHTSPNASCTVQDAWREDAAGPSASLADADQAPDKQDLDTSPIDITLKPTKAQAKRKDVSEGQANAPGAQIEAKGNATIAARLQGDCMQTGLQSVWFLNYLQ